jgi:hypothetical protein
MTLDRTSLEELKRICAQSLERNLSDADLQDVGQRIIRFLAYSEDCADAATPLTEFERVR